MDCWLGFNVKSTKLDNTYLYSEFLITYEMTTDATVGTPGEITTKAKKIESYCDPDVCTQRYNGYIDFDLTDSTFTDTLANKDIQAFDSIYLRFKTSENAKSTFKKRKFDCTDDMYVDYFDGSAYGQQIPLDPDYFTLDWNNDDL